MGRSDSDIDLETLQKVAELTGGNHTTQRMLPLSIRSMKISTN